MKTTRPYIAIIASLILLTLTGCWDTGSGQYVGIVTKTAQIGAVFQTYEAEIHLVDAKGVMIADSVELSVDSENPNASSLFHQLHNAQLDGTRVRITANRELWVAPWRGEQNRLVVLVEPLL